MAEPCELSGWMVTRPMHASEPLPDGQGLTI
jgi:hypothetical protein